MDKNTLTEYGWIIIIVIILAILIAFASPFAYFVVTSVKSVMSGVTQQVIVPPKESLTLPAPENLRITDSVLSFDPVPGATGYVITIGDSILFETPETSIDIAMQIAGVDDDVEITVSATNGTDVGPASKILYTLAGLYETGTKNMIYSWSKLIELNILDSDGKIISGQEALLDGDLVMPNAMTKIQDFSYANCSELTSVTMPPALTTIGEQAFANCKALANVIIPDSAENIGYRAFVGCDAITSITIPGKVKSLFATFNSCTSLAEVVIDPGVTSIHADAFSNCGNLSKVTIPNTVKTCASNTFYGCTALKDVYFNGTLEEWCSINMASFSSNPCANGANLYLNNKLLTDLIIPNGLTSVKQYAFLGCTSITSLTIPEGINTIGAQAFLGCTNLTDVKTPQSLVTIGKGAFRRCSSLANITLKNGLEDIAEDVFNECPKLKSVYFEGTLEEWCSITFTHYLSNPCTNGAALYINNVPVNEVEIPASLIAVPKNAFWGCTSLTRVILPAGITGVGNSAFANCANLVRVDIADSVASFDNSAFSRCFALKEVYYSGDVNTWCDMTFGDYWANPCSYGAKLYIDGTALTTLEIPSGRTSIGDYAFTSCNVSSVVIPEGVTAIGKGAFMSNKSIKSITLPSTLTSIDAQAFCDCASLTSITFNGMKDQWAAIIVNFGADWNKNTAGYTVHCADGNVSKS